jgi:MYXO-CTERM domain-containing protein
MKRHHPWRRGALAGAALAALGGTSHPALAIDYVWTSGFYTPGVTAPEPITAADRLLIDSGGNKFVSAATLTNAGTVRWLADPLYLQSGAVVDNLGSWESAADTTLAYNGGDAVTFINRGAFRKTGGSGVTVINANTGFVNHGLVEAQTGTIRFDGGATFNAGSSFGGAGSVVMGNGTNNFAGAFTSSNLVLQGGTFAGSGAVVNGSVSLTGGTIAGTWTVAAGQTLAGNDGGNKFLSGDTTVLTNQGTIAWNSGNPLYLQSGARLVNQGLFVANADTTLAYNGGATTTFDTVAGGTVRAAAGKTLNVGTIAFVSHAATLEAEAGGAIVYGGGNARFETGTQFVGAGSNRVTANVVFDGAFTSSNLVIAGGAASGSNAVLNGNVSFTGGTLADSWAVAAGATLHGDAGGNKFLSGASTVLTNHGTIAWNSGDPLYMQSGARLVNQALFVATADTALAYNGGATTTFDNTAAGTVRAAAGRTLNVGTVDFVNRGALEAELGAAIVYSGGTARFEDGTRFVGAGVNRVTSNALFSGGFGSQNLVIAGGTASGNAAVIGGLAGFGGGTLAGTWTVGAGQVLDGRAGGNKFLSGDTTVLTNQGTITWTTAEPFYLQSGARLVNQALFVAEADTAVHYNGGAAVTFQNTAAGTVRAAAGRTLTIGTLAFVNDGGRLDAEAGALLVYGGGNARFNDGTRFTGAGENRVTSNAVFSGAFDSQNLHIAGGTASGDAAVARGNTAFSGGTLAGGWTVAAGHTLSGADGGNKFLSGAGTTFVNEGTVNWTTANPWYLQSSAALDNRGRFDFGADGSWFYNGGASPLAENHGLVVKSGGSGSSTIGDGLGFRNWGTLLVQSGTLALPTNWTNEGLMTGSTRFAAGGTLTNTGHLAAGDGGIGTLALGANFAQSAAGVFDVELESLGLTDLLNVTGSAALGGTLALACHGACSFAVGDQIVILDATGELSGSFAAVTLSGFGSGAFDVVYDGLQDRVLLQVTQAVTAVPEPSTWALWLAGLAMAGGLRRRLRSE